MSSYDLSPVSSVDEGREPGKFVPETLSDHELQQHLAMVVREFAARIESGADIQPFTGPRAVSVTDVMIVVSRMLKTVGVEVFELGMWQAWTGGR